MLKNIASRPAWLKATHVEDIYSVSGCVSETFMNCPYDWKHNGWFFFDSPAIAYDIALEKGNTAELRLFYYEIFEKQFDGKVWSPIAPEDFPTVVQIPASKKLLGYDVVTFFGGPVPECSPLSCNSIASEMPVNRHCLLDSFEAAHKFVKSPILDDAEPGPYRIFAVYGLTDEACSQAKPPL